MDAAPPSAGPARVEAVAHVYVARLDDDVDVEGADARHLVGVRRLREGETVTASDGFGRWRVYRIARATRTLLGIRAVSGLAHEPRLRPELTLACALTKGAKADLVVQKLTELGADTIVLFRAARSIAKWSDEREAAALDRLRRIARQAGAQSRRARLPVVDGLVPFAEVAAHPGVVVADRSGVTAAELRWPPSGEWVVVVGPEGGFDDAESALLGGAPRLGVGPFVLRADTAAIGAAAAVTWRRSYDGGHLLPTMARGVS